MDCPVDAVEAVARKLTGGAGCSSVDAALLRNMLLRHGRASAELREELSAWARWLANTSPPWAAYRAMRQGRLVALDKQPGVRPLGIGESWMRAVAKLVLTELGRDGKAACGSTQLCAGLEAGIEGAIHAATLKATDDHSFRFDDWEIEDSTWLAEAEDGATPPWENSPQPDCPLTQDPADTTPDPTVLALADAENGFQNLGRYSLLWEVRHRWPSGARFAFNMYRHECRLMLRGPTGTPPIIILSREGVMQGCVWGMILYGIGLLPLAEDLRRQDPSILQPWYADDFALEGPAESVARLFQRLCQRGPDVGYFPAPAKSYVVCPRAFESVAKAAFDAADLPVQFSRGQRYVGGFVGSTSKRDRWLAPLVEKWVLGVKRLSAVALRFPHSAYAGLVSCLSAEWHYASRAVPDIGPLLAPIEEALRTHFLPAILGRTDPIDDDLRRLLSLGVKQGGLAIRNPAEGADALFHCSRAATETLVHSLLTNQPLGLDNHRSCVRNAGASYRSTRKESDEAFRTALLARATPKVRKRLERQAATGAWLTTIPDRFGGTELSKTEWHDNVSIRYGWRPLALPDRCDGCGEGFTVEHGLNCKKGGLVSIRHDDIRDEWAHLCSLSLSSSRVTVEPTIFYGGGVTASQRSEHPTQGVNHLGDEARGDVLAHGFWQRARGTIFDIRLCDTDARSYGNTESSKILERAATEKKRKYEAACLERRRDFTPLVYSVDGLASKDTRAAEKRLACLLSKKWSRAYSEMVGFIRVRMSLAIARSITLLLRGDRSYSPQRRAPTDGVAANSCPAIQIT